MGDFLHKNASTPYIEDFLAAGASCRIATNCLPIFEAARQSFAPAAGPVSAPELSMRFWVDRNTRHEGRWLQPHLRGSGDLVFAGFDSGSFALFDLRCRRIVGRFSQAVATDTDYWNRVIFPMMMSVVAATIGIAELHCACVAKGGRGLLLSGKSGSGKSTLSLALSSRGFGFLSDDRTFISLRGGKLLAWAPLTELKLRSGAINSFPELNWAEANVAEIGQHSLRLPPESLGLIRARECEPGALIFLEPRPCSGFRLLNISQTEAESRLRDDLMAESPESELRQVANIAELSARPSAVLQYSDPPPSVANTLAARFEDMHSRNRPWSFLISSKDQIPQDAAMHTAGNAGPRAADLIASDTSPLTVPQDPLGRFILLPYSADLTLMGRKVSFRTNNSRILEHVHQLMSVYPAGAGSGPHFHWSIISQPREASPACSFRRFAFSDPGLRFAQFSEHSFFAIDIDSRSAFAFVTEQMVEEGLSITAPFLDSFFCACAASMGFVALFSSCVGTTGKGVLIMGEPGSGKTTAAYLSVLDGLRVHADEGVFLETHQGGLRGWGGFWPIIFRGDALRFFPELKKIARPFVYHDFSFFHVSKEKLQSRELPPFSPVACVFLHRNSQSSPFVSRIDLKDCGARLMKSLLLEEEERFLPQEHAILKMAAELPAYQVTYGPDPAVAAATIREILARHAS